MKNDKTFEGLKFKRSYIGGTKQSESNLFDVVQDVKNDYENVDYIKYREMLIHYGNDILHIMISYELVLKHISIALSLLTIYMVITLTNSLIFIIPLIISIISGISFIYLRNKGRKRLAQYWTCIDIVNSEIETQTTYKLPKI